MSQDSDKKFFTLFTLVVVALTILMVAFYFLGARNGSNPVSPLNLKSSSAEAPAPMVAEEPAAEMEMAAASDDTTDGKAIYDNVCVACHSGAIPGIPKPGDKADWEARIAQGNDVLYEHAINGFMGASMPMPPKGGADLSDDEVKAAVDYMVQSSQ